ncbi:23S rRNA pseudouridine(2605) synthase RluB [Pseudomonadota bacterium]
MVGEKLQKVLARQGKGSRREIERWIANGRVMVNGEVANLGIRVDGSEVVLVDGQPVKISNRKQKLSSRVLVYNKPAGQLCTRQDPKGRPTIFESLPDIDDSRWITVGRLDFNTTGLLLVTNDGELAARLMHPRHQIEREYACRVFGEATPRKLAQLTKGVLLDAHLCKFNSIVDKGGQGVNHSYHVTLKEGRNREVRRLWEAVGLTVSRLLRVRFGPILLPKKLKQGAWIELDFEKVKQLKQVVQLSAS